MKQITEFEKKVYKILKRVPRGNVTIYTELAKAVGRPRAMRAVGNALNKNPYAPEVPCHRVVKSCGSLGGFASGERKKAELLKKEGIKVVKGRIKNFNLILYKF